MKFQLSNIPLCVIEGAVKGETDALEYVLSHFKNYINTLATKVFKDENGSEHYYVDSDIVTRLETKLVYSIMNGFKIRY